jgi:hypothetical protein
LKGIGVGGTREKKEKKRKKREEEMSPEDLYLPTFSNLARF